MQSPKRGNRNLVRYQISKIPYALIRRVKFILRVARNRGKFEKRLSTNDKEEKGNLERFCKSEKNKKNEKNKNTSEGCTYELIKSKLLVNKKNNGR